MAGYRDVATDQDMIRIANAIRAVSRTSEGMTIPEMAERLLDVRVVEYSEHEAVIAASSVNIGTYDPNIKHLFVVLPLSITSVDALKKANAAPELVFDAETGDLSLEVEEATGDEVSLMVLDFLLAASTEESVGVLVYHRDTIEGIKVGDSLQEVVDRIAQLPAYPSKVSELENDEEYADEEYVDSAFQVTDVIIEEDELNGNDSD